MRSVFEASALAFLVVNVAENMVHYSIGRARRDGDEGAPRPWWHVRLRMPDAGDAVRIAVVMVVFALLQGVVTRALLRWG